MHFDVLAAEKREYLFHKLSSWQSLTDRHVETKIKVVI
jgi:hypothetical protein